MKKTIPLLLLIAAAVLYYLFSGSNLTLVEQTDSRKSDGKVLKVFGSLIGKGEQDSHFKDLTIDAPLFAPTKLITGFKGKAIIDFGGVVILDPNSSALLSIENGQYHIHLLSGGLLKPKPLPNVHVMVDGQEAPQNRVLKDEKVELTDIPQGEFQASTAKDEQKTNPVESTQLIETFKYQKRFFEKCFIKHYERKEGQTQSGQVMAEFTLTRKGQIENIKLAESDYKDQEFLDCLKEVISRVHLKTPISNRDQLVRFPIKLTLPE